MAAIKLPKVVTPPLDAILTCEIKLKFAGSYPPPKTPLMEFEQTPAPALTPVKSPKSSASHKLLMVIKSITFKIPEGVVPPTNNPLLELEQPLWPPLVPLRLPKSFP